MTKLFLSVDLTIPHKQKFCDFSRPIILHFKFHECSHFLWQVKILQPYTKNVSSGVKHQCPAQNFHSHSKSKHSKKFFPFLLKKRNTNTVKQSCYWHKKNTNIEKHCSYWHVKDKHQACKIVQLMTKILRLKLRLSMSVKPWHCISKANWKQLSLNITMSWSSKKSSVHL